MPNIKTINENVNQIFDFNKANTQLIEQRLINSANNGRLSASESLEIMICHISTLASKLEENKKELFGSMGEPMGDFSQSRQFRDISANYALPVIASYFIFEKIIIPGNNSPIKYPEKNLSNNGCTAHSPALEVRNPQVLLGVILLFIASSFVYIRRNKMLDYSQNIEKIQNKIINQTTNLDYLKRLLQEASNRYDIQSDPFETNLANIIANMNVENMFRDITDCKLCLDKASHKLNNELKKLKTLKKLLNLKTNSAIQKKQVIETIENMMFDFLNNPSLKREIFRIHEANLNIPISATINPTSIPTFKNIIQNAIKVEGQLCTSLNPTKINKLSKQNIKDACEIIPQLILSNKEIEKTPRIIDIETKKDKAIFLMHVARDIDKLLNKLLEHNSPSNNIYSITSNNPCISESNNVLTEITTVSLEIWLFVEALWFLTTQTNYYNNSEGTPRGNAPRIRTDEHGYTKTGCDGYYLPSTDPEQCCRRTQFKGETVGLSLACIVALFALPALLITAHLSMCEYVVQQNKTHPQRNQILKKKTHLTDSEKQKIIDITSKFLNIDSLNNNPRFRDIKQAQKLIKLEIKKLNRFAKNKANETQVSAFDLQDDSVENKYEAIINSLFKPDEPDLESAYSFYNQHPPINPDHESSQQSNNNMHGMLNYLINQSIN